MTNREALLMAYALAEDVKKKESRRWRKYMLTYVEDLCLSILREDDLDRVRTICTDTIKKNRKNAK